MRKNMKREVKKNGYIMKLHYIKQKSTRNEEEQRIEVISEFQHS